MLRTRRCAAAVTALAVTTLCCASPLPAHAASSPSPSSGVHVDPGSPAAKEYAIPLGQARGIGGGGGTGAAAGGPAPLFGAGISPQRLRVRQTGGTRSNRAGEARVLRSSRRSVSAARSGASTRQGFPAAAPDATISPRSARRTLGSTGSDGELGWMGGAAVAVLVIGGAGAALLSRGRRSRLPAS